MNPLIMTLLFCSPVFAGIAVALYLKRLHKQEELDETEYLHTLSEEEKKSYLAEKNNALLKQQRAYSINGVAAGKQNR